MVSGSYDSKDLNLRDMDKLLMGTLQLEKLLQLANLRTLLSLLLLEVSEMSTNRFDNFLKRRMIKYKKGLQMK